MIFADAQQCALYVLAVFGFVAIVAAVAWTVEFLIDQCGGD